MPIAATRPVARILCDLMVPMRDGVRLATDVHLPEGPGPWPALLERTPYDKRAPRANEHTRAHPQVFDRDELAGFFTAAGFAVVFQDCRGRYGSEGRFTKYRGEAEDGFDTLAWIAAEPWCDGKDRHVGHVLFRAHPDGGGCPRASGPRGNGGRLRRLLERLPGRHPLWRRLSSSSR